MQHMQVTVVLKIPATNGEEEISVSQRGYEQQQKN